MIDIHTHTFNALYLPLMNIARGRVGEYALGKPLSATVVNVIVQGIINKTIENQQMGQPNRGLNTLKDFSTNNPYGSLAAELGISVETVVQGRQTFPGFLKSAELPASASAIFLPSPTEIETIIKDNENWFRFSDLVFGAEDPKAGDDLRTLAEFTKRKSKLAEFLNALMSSDTSLRRTLAEAFNHEVALFVHHTMDMGPTYAQAPDDTSFWSFHGKQLARARELDQTDTTQSPAFLHFVAFSPFRATSVERKTPSTDWKTSTPIKLVQQALANGAWGVKYYPPAGYRPSGNAIPLRPAFGRLQKAQWDSRYADFSNDELDRLNFAFFEFCAENDIPVFAHCGYGEFQASKCYGERMAHPAYYREVLERLAARPKPLHLRLCLGHSGGADFWFGGEDARHKEWGQQVFELCTRFPNVYCEVGILAEATQSGNQATFARRLNALFNAPAVPGRYPFASKMIYGTDWFMPDAAATGIAFLEGYRSVFRSHPTLAKHSKEFFCLNALAFLGISPAGEASIQTNRAALLRELKPLVERAHR